MPTTTTKIAPIKTSPVGIVESSLYGLNRRSIPRRTAKAGYSTPNPPELPGASEAPAAQVFLTVGSSDAGSECTGPLLGLLVIRGFFAN